MKSTDCFAQAAWFKRFLHHFSTALPGTNRILLWMAWILAFAVVEGSMSAQTFPGTFSAKNIVDGVRRLILTKDGTPLKASVGKVEILRDGNLLISGGLVQDGTFIFGVVTVEGTQPGAKINLTVRAWDNSTGTTFDSATLRGSQTFEVGPLGGATQPPVELANLSSLQLSTVNNGPLGTFSARNVVDGQTVSILDASGTPLSTASGAVEFLANGAVFLSGGLIEDGAFALGVAAIPGSKVGGIAMVTIRAWDKTTGATYDLASSRASETISVGPLGGDLAPPVPLSNFKPLTLSGTANTAVGTLSAKNLIGAEKRYILDVNGKPLPTANGAVELIANNRVFASGGLVEDGIFVLGAVSVPGSVEGATLDVTVRAWDKNTGSSFDSATTRGSLTFPVGPLGGSITPPAVMDRFASFPLVATSAVTGGTFSAKNLIGTERRYVLNAAGAPLPASIGAMEIEYQGTVIKAGTLALDGVFILGTTPIPGTTQGQTVTLTFHFWDTSSGATYALATRKGSQDVLVGPLGGGITPPVGLDNFRSFAIGSGVIPPVITSQPAASVVRNQGASAVLSVTATGTGLNFQWQKDGTNLKDAAGIGGSGTSTLTLSSLSAASRGVYRVIVSNSGGSVTNAGTILGVLLPQTLSFGTLPALRYGDSAKLTPSSSSGLPVTLKVISGPATLVGNTVTATGIGSVLLGVSQAGSAEFQPADAIASLTIQKAIQKLTWPALPALTYGDAPVSVAVTASSGLPVELTSTTPGKPVTVAGATITVVTAGSATLKATQAGSALYESISETRPLTVAKASQTLTFTALTDTPWKSSAIPLVATASSKLPVAFTVVTGAARIQGTNLTLLDTGVGTVTVNASQEGDSNFLPATAVRRSFVVTKASQSITFTPIPDLTEGDPAISLSATASSGLTVTFSGNANNVATLTANLLTPKAAGTVVITAKQAGNAVYDSVQSTQTINIKSKPTIAPIARLNGVKGQWVVLFRGEKGRAHAVDASTTLTGTWQELITADGAGPDADVSVPLPASSEPVRYFRIRAK